PDLVAASVPRERHVLGGQRTGSDANIDGVLQRKYRGPGGHAQHAEGPSTAFFHWPRLRQYSAARPFSMVSGQDRVGVALEILGQDLDRIRSESEFPQCAEELVVHR